MARGKLLMVAALALSACADSAPPQIGVAISTAPARAAEVAAAEQSRGDPGHFDPLISQAGSTLAAAAALRVAQEFVENERVIAVVGHGNSAASLAASQVYNAGGLVQIAPTTTAPIYSDAGHFSFRLVPSDTMQAVFLAETLARRWPDAPRIAVVHVNDDYGRGLFRQLRPKLGQVVFEGVYAEAADEWEFAALARLIAAKQPDLLLWLGRSRPLGLVLTGLRPAVPQLHLLCGDGCDGTLVYNNSNGIYTGLVFVRFTDPRADTPALRAFQERYHAHTGQTPSSEAVLTYDAVSLVRAALRDGARTREQVRTYLASLGTERPPFSGLSGNISFDATGSVARSYLLAEVIAPDSVVAADAAGN